MSKKAIQEYLHDFYFYGERVVDLLSRLRDVCNSYVAKGYFDFTYEHNPEETCIRLYGKRYETDDEYKKRMARKTRSALASAARRARERAAQEKSERLLLAKLQQKYADGEPTMTIFQYKRGTSDKFWCYGVVNNTVTVKWGRTGTTGQSKIHAFSDQTELWNFVNKLIDSKLNKGYLRVS
jgi:predicted DNA-binding WGR domain protein